MNKATTSGTILLLVLTLVTAVLTAAGDTELERKVDDFLRPATESDLISGAVLIAKKGDILLAKGYGLANREYDIPNTPETRFRLASVSKQFTAMAIMILEERGLLSVDDPVSKYYPDFKSGDKVTLHHLLTHTSGVVNNNDLSDFNEKMLQPLSIDEVIDWIKDEPLLFEPATQFAYSNFGYILLAGIIEKVSGETYADFLQDNIFGPLDMYGSGQDVFTTVIKNRATGYGSDGQRVYQAPYRDMPFMSGAGSLYSTVLDMHKWDQALYAETLVSRETLDRIFTPDKENYGYGWFITERDGKRLITHRGGINGFITNIDRFVDDTLLVVVLLNYESTFSMRAIRGITDIALGNDPTPLLATTPPDIAAETLDSYAGQYRLALDTTMIYTVGVDDQGLYVVDPAYNLTHYAAPQTENLFFVEGMNSLVRFDAGEDGAIARLVIVNGVHSFQAARI